MPILVGIIAIKKMLILAAAAVPAVIALLRICRFPGGFGGLTAATAAAAPIVGTPYVTSDTIIGDFSNYAPALAAQQTPYYNKQPDYGGKSLNPFNQLTTFWKNLCTDINYEVLFSIEFKLKYFIIHNFLSILFDLEKMHKNTLHIAITTFIWKSIL